MFDILVVLLILFFHKNHQHNIWNQVKNCPIDNVYHIDIQGVEDFHIRAQLVVMYASFIYAVDLWCDVCVSRELVHRPS